jgi:putative sigma-54 modulation protein
MDLEILSKNLEIPAEVRKVIEQKIGKIPHYVKDAKEAKVELSFEKAKTPDKRFRAQVTVTVKGIILRAEDKAGNISAAFDNVSDTIIEQAKKYKDKRSKRGHGGSPVRQTDVKPASPTQPDDDQIPAYVDVVRVKRFPVKPMAVNEAIEQMELLGHDFFLFVNADNSRFCCLYHRKDGKYGLIETE